MKGNGKYKIPPIYADFEIKLTEAQIGDMMICRKTGRGCKIASIWISPICSEDRIFYNRDKTFYSILGINTMFVRY